MPTVQTPATVLVTGATGFIGAHTVKTLVESGFTVRAAVRRPESGEYLKKLSVGKEDKVTWTIVKDIEVENAFDEAVKGVDAILHLASPVDAFLSETATAKDVVGPAIAGTVGVLKSAQRFAPSVKRVVIVSSAVSAGFHTPDSSDEIIDETKWNEAAVAAVQADPNSTTLNGGLVYTASKTLAEKAAFDFVKENKDVGFDVVTLLPPYVFGPFIHDIPTAEKINASLLVFTGVVKEEKPAAERVQITGALIDVRDIAALLVLSLGSDKVAGERFLTNSGHWSPQAIYDALNSTTYGPAIPNAPKGTPGSTLRTPIKEYSNKKTLAAFDGFKFHTLEETAKDAAKALTDRGWLTFKN